MDNQFNFNDDKLQTESDENEIKFGFDDHFAADYAQEQVEQSGKKKKPHKTYSEEKLYKKKKIKKIISKIVFAVLLIAIITCAVVFTLKLIDKIDQKSVQKTLDRYMAGVEAQDLNATCDSFSLDYRNIEKQLLLALADASSEEEYWDNVKHKFGDDLVVTCNQFGYMKKVSDVKTLQRFVGRMYGNDVKIKKAYECTVKTTYKGTNGRLTLCHTITIAKVDGNWGVVRVNLYDVLKNNVEELDEEVKSPVVSPSEFDWTKMQFYYNGELYNFAEMTYGDLESMGYFVSDADYLLKRINEKRRSFEVLVHAADGSQMTVSFCNVSGDNITDVRDCAVVSMSLIDLDRAYNCSVALSNGVCKGMTIEEVESIMGAPYEDDGDAHEGWYYEMTYRASGDIPASVRLLFGDGKLRKIYIENREK